MAGELLVAMRSGGTPVPIPNTTVKTGTAEGTALETVWENRWPPDQKKESPASGAGRCTLKTSYSRKDREIKNKTSNQSKA